MEYGKLSRVLSLLCALLLVVTGCWLWAVAQPHQPPPTARAILDDRGAVMDGKEFLYLAAVNVNTADEKTLQSLPGIGEVLARRILDYRGEYGEFASIDDLDQIQGIGAKKLQQLHETAYTHKLS